MDWTRYLTLNILLIVTLLLSACFDTTEQPRMPSVLEVKVASPIRQELIEWDVYAGRFRAVDEVEIRARVSGYLHEVKFKDGQLVTKGDVLFVIDQRPFQYAVDSAKAQFELAKKELTRAKRLRQSNAIAQQELDKRLLELNIAKAALDRAELDLTFTKVRSPISGRVSRNLITEGNLVNGSDVNSTLLTTVVSIDPIHFYFDASERELLRYLRLDRLGLRETSRTKAHPVAVQLQDEQDFPHQGYMDFVDNRIDMNTGTIQGRALIENPGGFIHPGTFGRIRVPGSAKYKAVLIPDSLIGTNQSYRFVYVVENGQVTARNVKLGRLYKNHWRIIQEGLKANDQLIARSIQLVRPGMPVTTKVVDFRQEYQANRL